MGRSANRKHQFSTWSARDRKLSCVGTREYKEQVTINKPFVCLTGESATTTTITNATAPRTPQNAAYGFVFFGGSLTANPTTSTVRSNHVYLGRPWGPYAAAAFLNVAMGAHIATDGWTTMSDNTLAQTHFWEYKSTGAGANPSNGTRSSRQLSDSQAANYTVAKVLSSWTPNYSQ